MIRKLYAFLAITLFTATAFTFTEEGENLTEKIALKLEQYRLTTPQEKVYLHFDKPYYMAGETMWFQGYLFDGMIHKVDSVSRVLYVDLIDETKGKVIASRILKCDGSTHGDFVLPDSLAEGIYHIRAYTNYMKNYSEEFFFHQNFKIWQGSIKNRLSDENALKLTQAADIQFFPEGGNTVIGITSRIGFKAINVAGKGVDVQGFVLDNMKDTVAAFQSEHLGMGYFSFTPEEQKTYTAYIKQNDGKVLPFAMPATYAQGYTIAVDNLSNKEKVKIFVSNSSPVSADKSKELIIVAHQRGQLCFIAKGNETQKTFGISIPKTKIPDDGIVQVTLMNAQGEPICERVFFHSQQQKQLTLKVTPDKASYKHREKVTVNIEATNPDGKPVIGNFSVAVTDAKQVLTEPYQENLLSYLLISSDVSSLSSNEYYSTLRGNIEQPAYYFNKENPEANRHLDMLMMTQGWRRFIWKDLMSDKQPKLANFLETGLEVTGKALRPNGKVADNVTLTLMVKNPKQDPIFQMGITDSLGRYGFYGLDFNDSTQIFVQGMKKGGSKNLDVSIDGLKPTPTVRIIKTPYKAIEFNTQELAIFLKKTNEAIELDKKMRLSKDSQLLEGVTVKAKKIEEHDSRKIYSNPQSSIQVNQQLCAGANSIFQIIQGRVAGVQVSSNGQGGYTVLIRGISSISASNEPLYLLDGMPVDADALSSITPCDVDKIDILKGAEAAMFGSRGATGVISVLTKRGSGNYDYSKDPVLGISVQKRMGYNVAREFYAPKYDVDIPDHVRPDFRSTLHWQPNVRTDANGKASITYWNTDASTDVRIMIEGVSAQGNIGIAKIEYGVK
ncbi:TonB-dependent receptor plug domain-containing protein [Arcicella sp. LKC2W]|uniref:TonB-dependent receptor plug domain-containing protein n=1 Tax=Arcicella sp. LKC2W TaxID=2984198 RepID=UPI002B21A672|nr:TonB-dependent receptor plug domain-containing protein [Arcicella sp. LKC2W]MEA5459047.1 TonB-dependent receptor plug domain-containing protein [Arcicella sp. LKC2W]